MVTCPICNKKMNYINNSHLKTHNLTPSDFKLKFPNLKYISQIVINKMSVKENSFNIAIEKNREIKKQNFLKLNKKCKNCEFLLDYDKRKNIFCSHKCSATFVNKERTVKYSEKGMQSLKENGLKTVFKNFKNYKENYINKSFNIECRICKKHFIVNYRKKLKQTCSPECKKKAYALFNHKQTKSYAKSGYYKGIYCASSWELAFLVFNKDLEKNIIRCDKHFEYEIKNKKHLYFPDFLMDKTIYEIKGRDFGDVKIKAQAVIDAGYNIEIFRRKEIMPLIKSIQEKYNIKDIIELYD